MNTSMNELSINDLEAVTGGSVGSTILHVAGGLAVMAIGSVIGPAGAIAAGLSYAAAEIAVEETT